MFYSSKKEQLVTLAEYVKGMQENQEFIYYACGESYEKIAKLPQIEKATAKGLTPKQFVDDVAGVIKRLWDKANISYDKFIRTTDKDHKERTAKIFAAIIKRTMPA